MKAIIFIFLTTGFLATAFLSMKIADRHYKTYKGDEPLYLIYTLLGEIIYIACVVELGEIFF